MPSLGLSVLVVAMAGRQLKKPGRQRLQTRQEISQLSNVRKDKLSSILNTRMRSALMGRVLISSQPGHLCTGISEAEERAWIEVVEQHFSFGHLDAAAEAAFADDLSHVGATLSQGYSLRNHLSGVKRRAYSDELRNWTETGWAHLEACAATCSVPPLEIVRHFLQVRAKPKLSKKLISTLVEAIVEVNSEGTLSTDSVLQSRRLRRLTYNARHALSAAVRQLDEDDQFWRTAAWACDHDTHGVPKYRAQRRSRAVERLAIRKLRAAGVCGRTERELRLRTTTPDLVIDNDPSGARWIDIKHTFGWGDVTRLTARTARYCADWGPGILIFTLGYTERIGAELRASNPVWVLDAHGAEQLFCNS